LRIGKCAENKVMQGVSNKMSLRKIGFLLLLVPCLFYGAWQAYSYYAAEQRVAQYNELILEKAHSGDENAQAELASWYISGYGRAQNLAKGIELYQKAAKKGSSLAIRSLGLLYQNGTGVEKDIDHAIKLFTLAAKDGDGISLNYLGDLYYTGNSVIEQNFTQAHEYYELAAEKGSLIRLVKLAGMYENGIGCTVNLSKAFQYYNLAAYLADSLEAQVRISVIILKQNPQINLSIASNNAADKQYNLALQYHKGEGTKQDVDLAITLYQEAASRGSILAQITVADLYFDGHEVPQSFSEAQRYYHLAAGTNNPYALYRLALMYQDGIGVESNILKAKWYFFKALKHRQYWREVV